MDASLHDWADIVLASVLASVGWIIRNAISHRRELDQKREELDKEIEKRLRRMEDGLLRLGIFDERRSGEERRTEYRQDPRDRRRLRKGEDEDED